MPAEWEPHAATWLAWPHNHDDWPGKFEPIPWVHAEIIRNLARHERVELIVNNARAQTQARKLLKLANALTPNVRFHRWPTNRAWLRDSGCIFLARQNRDHVARARVGIDRVGTGAPPVRAERSAAAGHRASDPIPSGPQALKFRFNAWAKYPNWRHDEKIGILMAKTAHAHEIRPTTNSTLRTRARIVLEGGSIDVNGLGTLLTTEECLLSPVQERNPGMTRVHYEKAFADYLGAPNVIWLGRGIVGDDTHGHVDDLTRFVSPDTVVTMVEPNSRDANHAPLLANLRRLQAASDQAGKSLNIVELPMPGSVVFEGRRLPASYANFYIANKSVLVPVFNDPNDRLVLNTLASLFRTRQVVPIYAGDLVWGLGTLHCMTQQQPEI
jgi:agmatine deiminase